MSYVSTTGTRPAGIFDELYVRNPPKIGPYVQILSGGLGGSDASKRDVSDSYSQSETESLIRSLAYSQAESDALFQTESASLSQLALKRDITNSLSTGETNALLAEKVDRSVYQSAISLKRDKEGSLSSVQTANLYQTKVDSAAALALKRDVSTSLSAAVIDASLALKRNIADSLTTGEVTALLGSKVDDTTYQSAISLKRDKEGSLSSVQTANLYQTKTASTASLALKRDISDSMSSTEIQALAALDRPISSITGLQGELDNRAGESATVIALSNKVDKEGSISLSESTANLLDRVKTPVPSGAVFSDTIFNPATDVPNGSLEISQIGGLTAVLGSFKNASDSDIADTVLRNDITALETVVEALPPSQILVNGSFLDQARFSISNALPQLNLSAGLWEWLVQPRWSDLQRDPMRIRHARAGTLALDPSPDSYCYFPRIGDGDEDLSPASVHWVVPISANQTSDYGTFKLAEITSALLGQTDGPRIFANTNTPTTQPSAKGVGWGSTAADSWCIEFQVKLLDASSVFNVKWSSDADLDIVDPDFLTSVHLHATGSFISKWEDRRGSSDSGESNGLVRQNAWQHVTIQKPTGDRLYFYLDGVLCFESAVTANPPQTIDLLWIYGTGTALWREFSVRASCPYPVTPFTPNAPVSFASLLGLGQQRFNSYMLQ